MPATAGNGPEIQISATTGVSASLRMPTGAIANQFLTAARGLGLEKEDCAAVFHVLAQLSGVKA